jgi:hypothetical protein
MKQAVGVDPASALGGAVREARMREKPAEYDVKVTDPGLPTGSTAPTIPDTRKKRESVDVEFSVADANVEPLELTNPKKTKPPT